MTGKNIFIENPRILSENKQMNKNVNLLELDLTINYLASLFYFATPKINLDELTKQQSKNYCDKILNNKSYSTDLTSGFL
ncbi:hypothetical protein BpHYR1_046034, partial [Brachionus plicatilis]